MDHLSKIKPKLKAEFSELLGASPPRPPPGLCTAPAETLLNFTRLWRVQRPSTFVFSDGRIFSGFLENLQSHAWWSCPQHSRTSNAKGKLKKVLNVYKVNISAAYNVSDIEIEEPPPIYDRGTKNKVEELDRLHAAMKEKLVIASNTEKLQILTLVRDSWLQKYCSEYLI